MSKSLFESSLKSIPGDPTDPFIPFILSIELVYVFSLKIPIHISRSDNSIKVLFDFFHRSINVYINEKG